MTSKRFIGSALVAAAGILAVVPGCSDADNPLCCSEFKAGATIGVEIQGSAQSQVAVQAVADFAGIANAAITDLASACRSIAQDLDTPAADIDAVETQANSQKPDDAQKTRMNGFCDLAVKAITKIKGEAQATVKVVVQPPKCEISASAKANCQAKCDVSGKCEAKAELKCTGGKLEVSCEGSCKAEVAGGEIQCEGSCSAECSGSCTAQGGVACQGKCEGTCEGAGGAGTSGVDAQGNCQGTCKGSCSVTKPGVQCQGSCKGGCKGECKASAPTAKVKCDGKCEGKAEPLKCDGKLEGGCNVDAKCNGSCDASVQAKAECTPPGITVEITGNASGAAQIEAIGKLKATFEANLGIVFSFKSRLEGMGKLAGTITANIDGIADIKVACIPQVAAAGVKAVADISASVKVTGDLVTNVQ